MLIILIIFFYFCKSQQPCKTNFNKSKQYSLRRILKLKKKMLKSKKLKNSKIKLLRLQNEMKIDTRCSFKELLIL